MFSLLLSIMGVALATLVVMFGLSFDTLEYNELGLNYSWMRDIVEDRTYTNGFHYLGLGNHFIVFPRMVKSIYFVNVRSSVNHGPPLQSRTRDGLNVHLEVSFQYRLVPENLYKIYTALGENYESIFVRMGIEQLTTAATMHTAYQFFNERAMIGKEMHRKLREHFQDHGFADVPFFQLRTVHLPSKFEEAIENTQVRQQEIEIATAEQTQNRVKFQTRVLQAQQDVLVLRNQAKAQAQSVLAQNNAYCSQYRYTQELQSSALQDVMTNAQWTPAQLLNYVKIRSVRDHPSNMTIMQV